jgi:alginate O-acetyltransferase complex protein AlgI
VLFPTLAFHIFFLAIFALNWLLRNALEWRKLLLLVASWVFYGVWDWRFVALLQASAVLNWAAAKAIDISTNINKGRRQRLGKAILISAIIANLLLLGFFKYFGFFALQVQGLLQMLGWQRDMAMISIILPVGISFFTFQGLSYVIDVYQGKTKPASLLDLTLLMSFFPHLVAGPIVRPSHILPQLQHPPRLTRGIVATSLLLILWGVVKKAVIANELSVHFVDPIFTAPQGHSAPDLLLAAYGYSVQIYCDFSAYSDMAIGLAGLLGFRFPFNFNQPYRAISLQDYWRRWHISLSTWLRDYLYIAAFGGSRQAQWRTTLALMGTMVLGGLWHGASWNFIIWGAIHGGILSAERLWKMCKPARWPVLPHYAQIILTFHIVTLAWIFFRCKELSTALQYMGGLGHWARLATSISVYQLGLIVFGLSCHALPKDAVQRLGAKLQAWPAWRVAVMVTLVLLFVEGMRGSGVAPFIYYQF